jgi:protein-tyrosine phosphatase
MASNVHWIDCDLSFRLAIMARPRSGDWLVDEIENWEREGVSAVLSLLERDEIQELGLQMEPMLCAERGIGYASYPIVDRGIPSDIGSLLELTDQLAQPHQAIAIHCRAGIGRSALVAAAIMLRHGVSADAALKAIEKARGLPIPDTAEQRKWVENLEMFFHEQGSIPSK